MAINPKPFRGGLDFANQAAFEDVLRAAEEEQLRQYMEKSRLADIAREEAKMAEYQRLFPNNNKFYGISPRPPIEVGRGGFQPPTIDLERATRNRTGDTDFIEPGAYQSGMDFANPSEMQPPGPTYGPTGMDFANPEGMVVPPPSNKASDIVNSSLNTGQRIARDQGLMSQARESASSFFSNAGDFLTSPVMKRILEIMARPEFQDPEGIAAGFAGAAYGIKQDEIKAAEKEMQRQRLENEAKRQAFFDKLRIEEAGRAQRREERAEKKAGETKYRILTANQETKLISRAKEIKEVADFVDANSATAFGRNVLGKDLPSSTVLYTDLVRAATEKMDEEKIPFDRAIRMVVQERQQPSTKSNVPQAQQSVDPADYVKIRKST